MQQVAHPRPTLLLFLVPFVLGIVLGDHLGIVAWCWPLALLSLSAAAFAVMRARASKPERRMAMRPWFYLPAACFFIALGWTDAQLNTPAPLPLNAINGRPQSLLVTNVEHRERSMRLTGYLQGWDQQVLLTAAQSNYLLGCGDVVVFEASLEPVANQGNPDEIDYQALMRRKGIIYRQQIIADKINVIGHTNSLQSVLGNTKAWIERQVLNTSLSPGNQAYALALVMGDRKLLDPELRERFSQAGIAHVLALSGLHVGIITMLIWLLLFPLDLMGLRKVRLLLTLALLAAFALLTGASASVMRATIMIGVSFGTYCTGRVYNALNTVIVAAVIVLAIWPLSLFDAGFQLSFITVGSIIVTLPHLSNPGSSGLWPWIKSIILTSVVAMASTGILSAYYFHQLPLTSVLANVTVLPIFPILMLLCTIAVALAAIGGELPGLDDAMTGLTSLIEQFAQGYSIGCLWISKWAILFYYLAVVLLWIAWTRRNRLVAMAGVASAIVLIGAVAIEHYRVPPAGVVFLNDYKLSPILCWDHGQAWLWNTTGETDLAAFKRRYSGLLAHRGITGITQVEGHALPVAQGKLGEPLSVLNGRLIAKATNAVMQNKMSIDVLLIDKKSKGDLGELTEWCTPRKVVIAGNVNKNRREKLLLEAKEMGIDCVALSQHGAIVW